MATNVLPPTQVSVFDPLKALTELQQQAIVRPNNPPAGIAGFIFDIPLEDNVELTSDITDHYVENNSAIQDNIALRPEVVMVSGLVAEVAYTSPAASTLQAPVTDRLPNNPALEPTLTAGAEQTRSAASVLAADAVRSVVNSGSTYNYYRNTSRTQLNLTKQSNAFLYFYQLWLGRELCSVETPWGVWTNMAIQSVKPEQHEDSRFISTFTVTFKRIRYAQDITINAGQLAGRAVEQQAPKTQNGNVGQVPKTPTQKRSILKRFYDFLSP